MKNILKIVKENVERCAQCDSKLELDEILGENDGETSLQWKCERCNEVAVIPVENVYLGRDFGGHWILDVINGLINYKETEDGGVCF